MGMRIIVDCQRRARLRRRDAGDRGETEAAADDGVGGSPPRFGRGCVSGGCCRRSGAPSGLSSRFSCASRACAPCWGSRRSVACGGGGGGGADAGAAEARPSHRSQGKLVGNALIARLRPCDPIRRARTAIDPAGGVIFSADSHGRRKPKVPLLSSVIRAAAGRRDGGQSAARPRARLLRERCVHRRLGLPDLAGMLARSPRVPVRRAQGFDATFVASRRR